ncbi:MAG: 50S ribosomal protein L4 [Acidimicrobiales bacterium]
MAASTLKLAVRTPTGTEAGTVDLAEAVFGIEPNMAVMHQVVTAQLARVAPVPTAPRPAPRFAVAGPSRGGRGHRSGPGRFVHVAHLAGGGIAHGPKPRDYTQRTPKKMVKLALRSALSDRAAEGNVIVVDAWSFDTPKTKDGVAALAALGVDGKALVVLGDGDENAWKSFRNVVGVHCVHVGELNTYDVLDADVVVFTKETLPGGES